MTQEQLAHTRFPLGELTKPEARELARRHGLVTADKPESQEICFVREGDYRAELQKRTDWQPTPGPLVDADGATVGEHAGAPAYTIGQRSGLGVALGERQYVAAIDTRRQPRHPGPARGPLPGALRRGRGLLHRRAAGATPSGRASASAIAPSPCPAWCVRPTATARWSVELDRPAWAPAPGQAAVFYDDGDAVIGGGRIDSSAAAAA